MCCFYFLKKNLAHCSFQKVTNSESVRKKERERERKNKKHLISQREEFGVLPFKLCTEYMKTHFFKEWVYIIGTILSIKVCIEILK